MFLSPVLIVLFLKVSMSGIMTFARCIELVCVVSLIKTQLTMDHMFSRFSLIMYFAKVKCCAYARVLCLLVCLCIAVGEGSALQVHLFFMLMQDSVFKYLSQKY